jgi:hypothetical protein
MVGFPPAWGTPAIGLDVSPEESLGGGTNQISGGGVLMSSIRPLLCLWEWTSRLMRVRKTDTRWRSYEIVMECLFTFSLPSSGTRCIHRSDYTALHPQEVVGNLQGWNGVLSWSICPCTFVGLYTYGIRYPRIAILHTLSALMLNLFRRNRWQRGSAVGIIFHV